MKKWKEIEGYEGLYLVSNHGEVKSLARTVETYNGQIRVFNERILTLHSSKITERHPKPMYHAELWKENKRRVFFIHRLVAEAFIPKVKGKNQINHKDGNRMNNNVDNLEWCTPSENSKHAYKIGLTKPKNEKPVKATSVKTNEVLTFKSIEEASRQVNGNSDAIRSALKGRTRTSKGYYWEFL